MKILSKRRRHESRTNYLKRKRLLESRKARVVIRKSNKYITIQYIESKAAQDNVKVSITSKELLEYGWPQEKAGSLKSLPAAYLTGLLFGNKAKKLASAVLDTGLIRSTKGSKIYSALKGMVDAGFVISHNPEVFPAVERIENENAKGFFDKVKSKIGASK
jgi:large subunit ribosomal protein L18